MLLTKKQTKKQKQRKKSLENNTPSPYRAITSSFGEGNAQTQLLGTKTKHYNTSRCVLAILEFIVSDVKTSSLCVYIQSDRISLQFVM